MEENEGEMGGRRGEGVWSRNFPLLLLLLALLFSKLMKICMIFISRFLSFLI